ncbi:MAG: glycosyltransferase family 39 protein [Anaerolineaceae bacterium]|nr:glycosyltransferase family 39 protein [Anaerolineaceae bacterium]
MSETPLSARKIPWRPVNSDLAGLLLAFLLVGLHYTWATPVLEASDEPHHFAFAEHVSRHWTLPVQVPGEITPWAQEGSQPPLYYILVAALISAIDTSDLPEVMRPNPHAIVGDPSAINNHNRFLHDTPFPPLQGTVLAIHVARFFSLLLSCGSVCAVWLAARELVTPIGQFSRSLPLLAAGLVAFNPQFLFNSASVNNDNLITLLASLVIWQMLALLRSGPNARRSLVLALVLALAAVSKLSGLLLLAPVGLAALWLAFQRGQWRDFTLFIFLTGLCLLVIAGPWYARNLALYGEFTGSQTMLDIFGRRPAPSLETMLTEEFRGLRYSYWGIFGAFNIFAPAFFYPLMDIVTLAGAAGTLRTLWQARAKRETLVPLSLLLLCVALFSIALIIWTLQTAASTGRLLFPVSAASSSLLALGLLRWRLPVRPVVFALGALAALIPLASIRPAYRSPPVVDALPATATPTDLSFENIELAGYVIPLGQVGPGDTLPVTLYWRPRERSDLNYSFFVHLLDDVGRILVRNYGFPGGGTLQTSRWQPGLIYEDRWELPVPSDARGDETLKVQIGWWKYPEDFTISAKNGDGVLVDPALFDAGSFSDGGAGEDLQLENAVWPLEYGNSIRLLAWEQDGPAITLLWEATAQPAPELQVFLHLLDNPVAGEPDRMLAQGDSPPSTATADWQPGERHLTQHLLVKTADAEPGEYRIFVGWYSMTQGWRLEADCPFSYCPLGRIDYPFAQHTGS